MKIQSLLLTLILVIPNLVYAVDITATNKERENIIREGKIRPYSRDGELKGYLVRSIRKGSLLEKMGLRDGDIIISVNDRPMKDAVKDLYFAKTLIISSEFTLGVVSKEKEIRVLNIRFITISKT